MTNPHSISAAEYHALVAEGMPEGKLQAAIIGAAQRLGWLVYHTHDSRRSQAGFPDLVLVHPSHGVLFRELKTETGRLTAAQKTWIDTLTVAGANAAVWRPLAWLDGTVTAELSGETR